MTRAPRSASTIVQYGPASTRVRSTTVTSAKGPERSTDRAGSAQPGELPGDRVAAHVAVDDVAALRSLRRGLARGLPPRRLHRLARTLLRRLLRSRHGGRISSCA